MSSDDELYNGFNNAMDLICEGNWNRTNDFTDIILQPCSFALFFISGTDFIGLLLAIVHYFFIRRYHNLNGEKNSEQKPTAIFLINLQFFCLLMIAFSWVWARLSYGPFLSTYTFHAIFSDILHLLSWFAILGVTYLEWNRSLPHSLKFRLFWVFSFIAPGVDYYFDLTTQRDEVYTVEILGSVITISCWGIIIVTGLLGFIPLFRKYFEADMSLAQDKFSEDKTESNEEAGGSSFMLLMKKLIMKSTIVYFFLGACVSISRGLLLQQMFDAFGKVFADAQNDPSSLLDSVIGLLFFFTAFTCAGGLSSFLWGMGAEHSVNGMTGLRKTLFSKSLRQDISYLHTISTGSLVSKFSGDAERVKIIFTEVFPLFLEGISIVSVGMIYLMQYVRITLYIFSIVPLSYGISYYQTELFQLFEAEGRVRTANMTSKVQDVFSKYSTVLVYGKKNTEKRLFRKLVLKGYNVLSQKAAFQSVILLFSEYLTHITSVLALYLGITILVDNPIEVGYPQFITYALYSINIVKGLVIILKVYPKVGEILGSVNEVLKMIDRNPEAPESVDGIGYLNDLQVDKGSIEFKDVRFGYPGSEDYTEVLKGLSFVIPPNSKVAVVGDSGAGKSTLFQLISKFYLPNSGQILIDGKNIADFDTDSVRRNMAYVSQESDIFAISVLENIVYGKGTKSHRLETAKEILSKMKMDIALDEVERQFIEEVKRAVSSANASDFADDQLDLVLGEGGKGLSGGQQQRLTISRAIFADPKILLLDEVTSALDQISEAVVQEALDNLTQNRTVLIIAHRLHTIENSDMILVMEKGTVVAQGSHQELMETSEKYQEMVAAASEGTIHRADSAEMERINKIPKNLRSLVSKVYLRLSDESKADERCDGYLNQMIDIIPDIDEIAQRENLLAWARPENFDRSMRLTTLGSLAGVYELEELKTQTLQKKKKRR